MKDRRLRIHNTLACYVASRRSRQTSLPINRPTLSISGRFSKAMETAYVNYKPMNFFDRHKSVKNRGVSATIYVAVTAAISAVATLLRDSSVYVR